MLSMRPSVLDRYLFREAGLTWLAVTVVLLAIMLSTRFARFLGMAAAGVLPQDLLLKIVALSSIQYLVILIPVSLLMAIMLALGRLYKDSEMAAIAACGVRLRALYRPFIRLAIGLAAITAILSFSASPWAGRTADFLIKQSQQQLALSAFEAGQFKTIPGVPAVFYVGAIYPEQGVLEDVFIRTYGERGPGVVTATQGIEAVDTNTGERSISLVDGHRYEGQAGDAQFRVLSFAEQGIRVAPPPFIYEASKRKVASTLSLLQSNSLEDAAELQWRASAPLSVLLLALLAVPLAHTTPRQGRYAKLILGIVAYVFYANMLGVAQAWVGKGQLPVWLGLWWVHAGVLLLAIWLYLRRDGRAAFRRRPAAAVPA